MPLVLLALVIAEFAVFSAVATRIGTFRAASVVAVVCVIGVLVMRWAGFSAAHEIRRAATRGDAPAALGAKGALFLAGGLLAVPGFVSDVVGLALLVPPVRRGLFARFTRGVTVVGPGVIDTTVIAESYEPVGSERQLEVIDVESWE